MIISDIYDRLSHDRVVIAVMLTVGHSSRPIRPMRECSVGPTRQRRCFPPFGMPQLSYERTTIPEWDRQATLATRMNCEHSIGVRQHRPTPWFLQDPVTVNCE